MTHDGLGKYLSEVITKAPGSTVDIAQVLKDTGTDVVVNYLPVGSEAATRWYTEQILEAPCAMVNCMPVFIAREDYWQARFRKAGVPIIGDDIKSQVGATIVHRVLTHLFRERGVELEHTYQLNFGGNTDFLNMLERERLMSKKISKTNSVQSQLATPMAKEDIHIGPSDYVPWLNDRKWAFIRLEGKSFGDVPLNVELKLEVHDSPNSAGIVIDAVRCCKLGLDRGLERHARRPGLVLHEVTADARCRTTRRIGRPRNSSPASRPRGGRRNGRAADVAAGRCGGGTRHTRDELVRRATREADSVDAGRRHGGEDAHAEVGVARDPMLPYYAYRGAEALVNALPQSVSYWLGDRAADALLATVPGTVRRPSRQPPSRDPDHRRPGVATPRPPQRPQPHALLGGRDGDVVAAHRTCRRGST